MDKVIRLIMIVSAREHKELLTLCVRTLFRCYDKFMFMLLSETRGRIFHDGVHGSQPLWLGQWVTVCTRSLSLSLSLSLTHIHKQWCRLCQEKKKRKTTGLTQVFLEIDSVVVRNVSVIGKLVKLTAKFKSSRLLRKITASQHLLKNFFYSI